MPAINGTSSSEIIRGTAAGDEIDFSQGGSDIVYALDGDDTIFGGAAFDASDNVSGGTGYDILNLTGDYSAGVVFGQNTLLGVEQISFGGGYSYALTLHNSVVPAGKMMTIDAYLGGANQSIHVDGSAETNGGFLFYDGVSNDTFIGGAQYDSFSLSYGGNDIAMGGGGNDVFNVGGALGTNDVLDGGDGSDVLYMSGDYSAGLVFDHAFVKSIETIGLLGDYFYKLATNDNFVGAGQSVSVTGYGIANTGSFWFNGSAETDGSFDIQDSLNGDYLIGSQGNDRFFVTRGGADLVSGIAGDDEFHMGASFHAGDMILGGSGKDVIFLDGDYAAGVTMNFLTISEIEEMVFVGGNDYRITTHEASVAAGENLSVLGYYLDAGDTIDFDGSAETNGSFNLVGGAGNDTMRGGAQSDEFSGYLGGDDRFYGGDGDDIVDFSGQFSTADFFDGGAGRDHAHIYTDTSAGVSLGSGTFVSMEALTFGGESSHRVTTENSLVAAGETLSVDAYWLPVDKSFYFDGTAETDGHFELTGGRGNDTLIGGQQADKLVLTTGDDLLMGGGGDDLIGANGSFNAKDRLFGGTGYDMVEFSGDHSTQVVFAENTILNIEQINFFWGFDYNFRLADGNLAAGKTMVLDGHFLGSDDDIRFDASAETDGAFDVLFGDGADIFRGGAKGDVISTGGGNDTITGGGGADTITGGAGADRFDFNSVAEIGLTAGNRDVITDFEQGLDRIDLEGIDALSTVAGLQSFTWIGAQQHTGAGATLRYQQFAGGNDTIVYGDVDADGVSDFALVLNGLFDLTAADFTSASISTIQGTQYADTLAGSAGGKILLGLDGDDTIMGAGGADTIWGGAGADQMWGGAGADQFKWSTASHTGLAAGSRDVIHDFQQGLDRIDLSAIDANTTVAGNQDFVFLGTGNHTGAGATLRTMQSGGNTIVFGDRDADGAADFAIQLTGLHTLTAADFVL